MAVVARGPGRSPANAAEFAANADRAAETYDRQWREARIIENGPMYLVDDTSQAIGAFKIRGATVAVAELARTGVEQVTLASSGSFGMACASAAHTVGIAATVFMARSVPASKQATIESLGGRVDARYPTYEAAKDAARQAGEAAGAQFIDGVGENVFRGNASLAREIVRSGLLAREDVAVVVPLGIGSLAVPTALYLAGVGYTTDLVVVEPLTHCKYLAALGGAAAPDNEDTLADGAAVAVVPALSAGILDEVTSTAIALSEREIAAGIEHLWQQHELRAEGAGALAAAAVLAAPDVFDGYAQVWTFVTGRNIADADFDAIVS